jgi:hypothetical protein
MPHRTIAELAAEGFTELQVSCATCRFVKDLPFGWLLRDRDPKDVTLGEIVSKLRCGKCGNPPGSAEPRKPTPTMQYAWGKGHSDRPADSG